ncbi:MAG: sulfate adenylyltransferase subunit CysN [Kiritimatiellia bacterium]|jgi:bifunctional enzyme CysN/CysC|nr:sulfate adenylyltransferase subunit CysN [Kiritimatiellia bacterium]MDD4174388.1 sulfate adenylyltransferase subunit CysN [Kiritimatiellia bacterium]MDD4441105.1 sulfate adenylyltransferase subunit CysN [Kiritimatiellia bacterium]MDX9792950.1 sulfate adenylyltransferase subunit CysN [Kiritimatiellia bacterium]
MNTIDTFLNEHEHKNLLRFITCGSVDDGKSTLIGRLLYDSKLIYEDQLSSLQDASAKNGTTGAGEIDYALLLDGLKAEREQGITIDVAYRYFATPQRKFIIADTPGHEQYTRNMATGASTANLAVILIDARYGVVTQTRRHAFIASLLGIGHLLVAVNKMDIGGYQEETFLQIRQAFQDFARKLDIPDIRYVPISALKGTNVVTRTPQATPWYEGPSLLEILETVDVSSDLNQRDLRFPVQVVLRPHLNFRGFAGSVVSGTVAPGDRIRVLPSNVTSTVARVVTAEGDLPEAFAPQAVTVELADEVDISSGDMIVHENNRPQVKDRFEAVVIWMSETPLKAGDRYLVRHAGRFVKARIDAVLYAVDVNTMEQRQAESLGLNGIGRVVVETTQPLYLDAYAANRATGSLILVDPLSNVTAGAAMVTDDVFVDTDAPRVVGDAAALLRDHVDRREFHWETGLVSAKDRLLRNRHVGKTVLVTGARAQAVQRFGKELELRLFKLNLNSYYLGYASLARGLASDVRDIRSEHDAQVQRLGELARILTDAGMIFITAIPEADAFTVERLKVLNAPNELLVVSLERDARRPVPAEAALDEAAEIAQNVDVVLALLADHRVIPEYCI